MNNKLINLFTMVLVAVLVVVSTYVVANFTRLSAGLYDESYFSRENPPQYRFMVIVDGTDKSYVQEIELGVMKAARDYGVAFEMWYFEGEDKENQVLKQFDIAVESGVDGVILQAFSDPRFADILSKANYRQVPVITLDEDIPSREKVCFMSYNDYAIGNMIGDSLQQVFLEKDITKGTIVLMQENLEDGKNMGSGIQEQLRDAFVIRPEIDEYIGDDSLNAEGKTGMILNTYSDLVAIVCSNGEETLGVIQALKDNNKINEVMVIGSDDYPEILDYVKRETITATVITDNERLGYEAIVNLVDYNNGAFVSDYKDIRVNLLTGQFVDAYIEEVGNRYEEK